MGSARSAAREKRKKARVQVGFPVEYKAGGTTGRGSVIDVSNLGAQVDRPTSPVSVGQEIQLRLQLGTSTIRMSGEVVRTTRKSFAVRFDAPDVRLQGLLEVMLSRRGPESDEID